LVIPTLRRADTFRYALATLLRQTHDDLEIVVQNNGRDSATETLVEETGDPRVRHCWTDKILTMSENWEAALAHTRGDFVAFIGDDDGMLADACAVADLVIRHTGAEIVSWLPYLYHWPTYIEPSLRNRLMAAVDYDLRIESVPSDRQLRRFYRFAVHYSRLPMIYNSFVHRSVIERAKGRIGRYFIGSAPDVTSGILNAAHSERFFLISRPLSMTGLSRHSTGRSMSAKEYGGGAAERLRRDFGDRQFDHRLVPLNSTQMMIVNDMLRVRDQVLADRGIGLDFLRVLETIAGHINDEPQFYEETRAAVAEMAARNRVDMSTVVIPPPLMNRPALACGATPIGPNKVQFVVDGESVPLATILDAVRMMERYAPRLNDGADLRHVEEPVLEDIRAGEVFGFGLGGRGLPLLSGGWGEPEAWGTWSVLKRATMRFSIGAAGCARIIAALTYRAFINPKQGALQIVCRANGIQIDQWKCTHKKSSGTRQLIIPAQAARGDCAVELEFIVSEPSAPFQFSASSDTRLLGLGVESVRFSA
jgi:glycosyltransferase involved in cell wall biosynthesis